MLLMSWRLMQGYIFLEKIILFQNYGQHPEHTDNVITVIIGLVQICKGSEDKIFVVDPFLVYVL